MCQTMISKKKSLQIPKINYRMEKEEYEKNMIKEYDFEEKKTCRFRRSITRWKICQGSSLPGDTYSLKLSQMSSGS